MLGHRLWPVLQRRYETWVTVRGKSSVFPDHPDFPPNFVCEQVNALDSNDLARVMAQVRPAVVINCVGLIKQHARAEDPLLAIETNALLPHRLALLCQAAGARLIHISTDCVFSGAKGAYTENDVADAQDLYGRTKLLGEVQTPPALTLRTSIIGRELHTRYGLLEWFLHQKQAVRGFRGAIYTGFPTDELARIIADYVLPNPDLTGLYQVASNPITKYDLLHIFNEAYGCGLTIHGEDDFKSDRSLCAERFQAKTGYIAPPWPEMVAAMALNRPAYYSDTMSEKTSY